MRSKNSKSLNKAELTHLGLVKEAGCVICDAVGVVEAHHIRQGDHFTACAVFPDCHRGPLGWHGTKALWRIRKMDELDALQETLRRVYG